jgi:hypothetical protein
MTGWGEPEDLPFRYPQDSAKPSGKRAEESSFFIL